MKELLFITDSFEHDKVFFREELIELASRYRVNAISCVNCQVPEDLQEINGVNWTVYGKHLNIFHVIIYFFRFWMNKYCWKEIHSIMKERKSKIMIRLYHSIRLYACSEKFFSFLKHEKYIQNRDGFVFYTYWNNYAALGIAMHKCENVKFISRIHGYDLYDEVFPGKRQPFKWLINQKVDAMFFVGQTPKDYYEAKHPEMKKSNCIIARLGTRKNEAVWCNDKADVFHIVSCSNVIPIKRVDLIVKALSKLDDAIEWTHFGYGNEYLRVQEMAHNVLDIKPNIKWNMVGAVDNKEIRNFYKYEKVDCFINVSKSEGAPVSIMEAMAASIPIIGPNVGDISYMIKGNGVLIEDVNCESVVIAIKKMIELSKNNKMYNEIRQKSYSIWNECYNNKRNIKEFVEMLESI